MATATDAQPTPTHEGNTPADDPNKDVSQPPVNERATAAANEALENTPEHDPDNAELESARKAVADEAAQGPGDQGTPDPAPDPQAQPDPGQGQQPAPAQSTKSSISVPKERLDEALRKAGEVALENARLRGENEALKTLRGQPAAAGNQPTTQPPQDQTKALREERLKLAEQFDTGDLTMSELRRKEAEIDDKIEALRTGSPSPANQAPAARPDLYYEERLAEVVAAHPYTAAIKDDHPIWESIYYDANVALAQQLAQQGQRVDPKNPVHDLMFRKEIGKAADHYGRTLPDHALKGARPTPQVQAPSTNGAQPAGANTPATGKPPSSPAATARRNKLQMAVNGPPDITQTGAPGPQAAAIDQGRILSMSDEEIAAQPEVERRRILPG